MLAYWSIARTQRSLGRLDEALAIQLRLAGEADAAGKPDGYVYEELGEILLVKGEAGVARSNFARAYALLSADQGLQAETPERLARLKRPGGVE